VQKVFLKNFRFPIDDERFSGSISYMKNEMNDYQGMFQLGEKVVVTDGFGAVDAEGVVVGFEGEHFVVIQDERGEVVKAHGQFVSDAEWHSKEYSF